MGFRLFSRNPRYWHNGERVVARTSWRMRLLLLGSYCKTITCDVPRGEIRIVWRYLYLLGGARVIGFGEVAAITYGYADTAVGGSWSAQNSIDVFPVGLRLHNGKEEHLCTFLGLGLFTNNTAWPDWMYWWEYLTDISGSQEAESREFVGWLAGWIGAPVVPPRDSGW